MTQPNEEKPADLSALPDTLCSAESIEREIADIRSKLKPLHVRLSFLKKELKEYCPHDRGDHQFEGDTVCDRCNAFLD